MKNFVTLVATALLLLPGVLSFGPVFGGSDGYLAAGGGVALGLAIGFLARRFTWALASTAAAALGAYLLFGGVFALRRTTMAGFVPTLDTLTRLVPLTVQSWRDLLTVSAPANTFVGPAVVPYLSGLVLALIGAWVALGAKRYLWALVPTFALLLIGILWGLDVAPLAALLGAGYGLVALLWAVWRRVEARAVDGEEIIVGGTAKADGGRRLGATAGLLAVATIASVVAAPLLGAGVDRQVLRQRVQPPLNLQDYASPLVSYRYLELEQKDVTLFTVSGLPEGTRIRLATLDAYDGHVFNVADASAGFLRVGERTGLNHPGTGASLDVRISDYAGVWIPGGGDVRGLTFGGPQAQQQADTLYYNAYGGTLLTTAGVASGDSYRVDLVLPKKAEDVQVTGAVSAVSEPQLERVPDIIGKIASDYAGEGGTPLQQLRKIEKALQENGFYSNGADGKSRAGHTAERVATMLNAPIMIGDDEQYAVAMALMARQLGIPARVVMGFYPKPGTATTGQLEVKGSMAHAWVEVPFEGAGWLTFDPTPTREPQTLVPKPKRVPKPQVLPPPDPPVNKADDPLDKPGDTDEEKQDGNDLLLRIALGIGIGLLGAGVLSSPFIIIGTLKKRRRLRRMNAEPVASRFSGGWNELVDAATDLGATVSPIATRRETAASLAAIYPAVQPQRIADVVDAGVFGAGEPSSAAAAALWSDVDQAVAGMRGQVSRWRRLRAFCSLGSFGRLRFAPPRVNLSGVLPRLSRKGTS